MQAVASAPGISASREIMYHADNAGRMNYGNPHSPYHSQQPSQSQNAANNQQHAQQNQQSQQSQQEGQGQQPAMQTMRLRQDPPPVTQSQPRSRKRKTPPNSGQDAMQPVPPPPPQASMQHTLPPPHTLVPPPHLLPPGYQYGPPDYTPGGMPPQHTLPPAPQPEQPMQESQDPNGSAANRTLSQSKRAEQNRKAQRAFRERRDQHVKALESRSQLLDAALASADEANRRWEECRALVDQLRIENAALRAALSQAQIMGVVPGGANGAPPPAPGANEENMNNASSVEGQKGPEDPKE